MEFTIYQIQCATGKSCTVIAGLRNTSGQDQQFYNGMQRLYTGPGTWVTPDDTGAFAQPLASGARRLVTMRFTLAAGQRPTRVELREGAFARGVEYTFS